MTLLKTIFVPPPPGAPARLLRILLRDGLILLIALAVIEAILRFVGPEYAHNLYDEEYTGSYLVDFNAVGCRGPAVPVAKQPGELRVLGLGDSTTFGTGVAATDTWPIQLQRILQAGSDRKISTMNAAAQGVNLKRLRLAYDERWSAYQPDVVVVLVSGNMISLAWIERDTAPIMPPYGATPHHPSRLKRLETQATRLYDHLCLPGFVSINTQRAMYWIGLLNHDVNPKVPAGALLAHGWEQGDLDRAIAPEAWSIFANDLRQLRDDVAAHHAQFIVAYAPSRFDISDSICDDEKEVPRDRLTIDPSARMAEICKAQGITYVNALEAVRNGRQHIEQEQHRHASMYVMFDYTHLDRDGHKALAEAIAREIVSMNSKK